MGLPPAFPWRNVLSAGGFLLAVAACAPRHVAPPMVSAPTGDQCLAGLRSLGIAYREAAPPPDPHPCGIDTPVLVTDDPEPYAHPVLMGCELATRVARWQAEAVNIEARHYFRQPIAAAVQPLIGYSCRQEIGSKRNYVSQHGYGRALDIGGWRLGDGTVVSVARDWHDQGRKGRFLHAVALDACRYFAVVLTPDVNAAHRSHFHVDIGDYRYCAPTGRH